MNHIGRSNHDAKHKEVDLLALNILLVLPGYPTINGIPSYATWLVEELKKRHHVTILVPGDSKDTQLFCENLDGVDICKIWIPTPFSATTPIKSFLRWVLAFPKTFLQIKRFLSSKNIQVIHTTFHSYNYIFRVIKLLGGPRYLVTLHGSETVYFDQIPRIDKALARFVISGATCVAAVSDALKIIACDRFPNVQIFTAHNGIDVNGSRGCFSLEEILATPLPERFCLLVGRLHPVKGVDTAIDSWLHVLNEEPEVHLLVVGGGSCQADFEKKIEELGVSERVHLLGAMDNSVVRRLMLAAEVLVMPSRSEGLPAACLEAGQASLPIVASRVGGIPEVVEDGVNGYLVEPSDPLELAEKVTYLLGNQNIRLQFGHDLFKKVTSQFSSVEGAARYCQLYRNCSAQAKSDTFNCG